MDRGGRLPDCGGLVAKRPWGGVAGFLSAPRPRDPSVPSQIRKNLPRALSPFASNEGGDEPTNVKLLPLWILLGVLGLVLGLHALGPDPDVSAGKRGPRILSGPGFPCTIELASGRRIELLEPPRRVLPTNAGIVDFLTALIGAERVVAVPRPADDYSRLRLRPAWDAVPRFSDYTAEVALALAPDLVLTNGWQSPETSALLAENGVAVVVTDTPHTWTDVLDTLRLFGRILDREERSRVLLEELERRRSALTSSSVHGSGLRALSYSNFGGGGSTAGGGTTVDVLLELAGLENAAATAGLEGYASLDHERLLAIDPDLLLVAAGSEDGSFPPSVEHLRGTPELATLRAVREDRIVLLPTELFATTSLELMTAAEVLVAELERMEGR